MRVTVRKARILRYGRICTRLSVRLWPCFLFQILCRFLFKFAPHGIIRPVFVIKRFKVAGERAHLICRIHCVVGGADLSEACCAHEPEKAQSGPAVCGALKILVAIGQYLVSGVTYRAIAFDVGVDEPAEVGCIALELSQIAVGLVAGKCRG